MFFSVIVIGCGLALVRSAAVSMTLLAAGYLWLSYGFRPLSEPARTANLVVLWQTIVFAMASAYVAEVRARREFILQKLLEEERAKTQEVLSNVLPEQIAQRLKTSPGVLAERHEDACVLFADIVNFTPFVVSHSAEEVIRLLDEVFSRFDELVERRGLEKIKTVGDAYMVAGGVLDGGEDHLHQLAELALDFRDSARHMGVRMRIGMDCGPIVAGVIGRKKYLYDLWGEAVNVASRMESLGIADRIQVTAGVADRLRDMFDLEERGIVEVKGIGPVSTYFLLSRSASSSSSSSDSSDNPVLASGSPPAPP